MSTNFLDKLEGIVNSGNPAVTDLSTKKQKRVMYDDENINYFCCSHVLAKGRS